MPPKRRQFDLGLIERLANMQCTESEIAVALDCDAATVNRRADVQAAIAKGREGGRMTLRRAQWQKALGTREKVVVDAQGKETVVQQRVDANVALLIWLGKQYLGQAEKAVVATGDLPAIEIIERLAPYAPEGSTGG